MSVAARVVRAVLGDYWSVGSAAWDMREGMSDAASSGLSWSALPLRLGLMVLACAGGSRHLDVAGSLAGRREWPPFLPFAHEYQAPVWEAVDLTDGLAAPAGAGLVLRRCDRPLGLVGGGLRLVGTFLGYSEREAGDEEGDGEYEAEVEQVDEPVQRVSAAVGALAGAGADEAAPHGSVTSSEATNCRSERSCP